jgi:hypothetical protein
MPHALHSVPLAPYVVEVTWFPFILLVLLYTYRKCLAGRQRKHVKPTDKSVRSSAQLPDTPGLIATVASLLLTALSIVLVVSFYLFRPLCKAAIGALAPLSGLGRMFRREFNKKDRTIFFFLALALGGCFTSQLTMAAHGACFIFSFLATSMLTMAACDSFIRALQVESDERFNNVVLCMFHLQLFSVYVGLRRIWPVDDWQYYALTWTTGTGLCVWTLTVYCIAHQAEAQRFKGSMNWLVLLFIFGDAEDQFD